MKNRRFMPALPIGLVFITILMACNSADDPIKEIEKKITALKLQHFDTSGFDMSQVKFKISDSTVDIEVPEWEDIYHIIPEVEFAGYSLSPASGTLQDFSQPVIYTITGDDASIKKYRVTVTLAEKPMNALVFWGGSDNFFYCLDAATASLQWRLGAPDEFTYSKPYYINEMLYLTDMSGFGYGKIAKTGKSRWFRPISSEGMESDVTVFGGNMYVGSNDDHLYCLDTTNGNLKWSFKTGSNVSTTPRVDANTVYFGSSDGKLYAANVTDGSKKWEFATAGIVHSSPLLYGDAVYIGCMDGALYCLNKSDGSVKWQFKHSNVSFAMSDPVIKSGLLYIGEWYSTNFQPGGLLAIEAATGKLVWEALKNTGIAATPVVSNGRVYITADDGMLHALDAMTGIPVWEAWILANGASAAVHNKTLFVGGGGTSFFYTFDALTGKEIWKYPIKSTGTSDALVVQGN